MKFGVYVHIPYCLQRCRYCDFTTFEFTEIMPPEKYLQLLLKEIRQRSQLFQSTVLSSLYFGGGTPSLIPADHILAIIQELANCGFPINSTTEVTIEINPATIDEKKLDLYLGGGINRFSVGAQSFDDDLLQLCGRRHQARDTRHTLDLLTQRELNYSFDLLFALPSQTLGQLNRDLDEVKAFDPPHLSAYCLTVPTGHPMSHGRPPEGIQLEMFDLIESRLANMGLAKYEISNFSRPGLESRHNWLYWTDQAYWGVGLSAHSYNPRVGNGVRFWNSTSLSNYQHQIEKLKQPTGLQSFSKNQIEYLQLHEALTDFCHTSLRVKEGLAEKELLNKFSFNYSHAVFLRLKNLQENGYLTRSLLGQWQLTSQGERLSNQVFLALTFSREDFFMTAQTN